MTDDRLKELLKTAVSEVLDERRDFIAEIVEEAFEDFALARAIEEGVSTQAVARAEVFDLLNARE
jgi:hypothetical protein